MSVRLENQESEHCIKIDDVCVQVNPLTSVSICCDGKIVSGLTVRQLMNILDSVNQTI